MGGMGKEQEGVFVRQRERKAEELARMAVRLEVIDDILSSLGPRTLRQALS